MNLFSGVGNQLLMKLHDRAGWLDRNCCIKPPSPSILMWSEMIHCHRKCPKVLGKMTDSMPGSRKIWHSFIVPFHLGADRCVVGLYRIANLCSDMTTVYLRKCDRQMLRKRSFPQLGNTVQCWEKQHQLNYSLSCSCYKLRSPQIKISTPRLCCISSQY